MGKLTNLIKTHCLWNRKLKEPTIETTNTTNRTSSDCGTCKGRSNNYRVVVVVVVSLDL